MKKIHVGFLVSYDFELLKTGIPLVYSEADQIFLSVDKNRLTWSGAPIEISQDFFNWIKEIDIDNKVQIIEEAYFVKGLSSMECEVRQRKSLSNFMGEGNWLIQLDADEYFIDFKSFVSTLKKYEAFLNLPQKKPIQIATFLVNIYKKVEGGFLYIDEATKCMTATNFPCYKVGRNTRKRIIYVPHLMFHETLSRDVKELEFKFENWGHKEEVNPFFLEKWKQATKDNYKELTDLFYLEPHKWKNLNFVEGNTIEEAMNNFKIYEFTPSKFYLWKKNFGQWFKFLFK